MIKNRKVAKAIKIAVCVIVVVALLAAYVCTGYVRKGFFSSMGIPAQYFTGVTVTNGNQKMKLKVSTYNYYFAMTYNNLRNQVEMYSQYGISAEEAGLDVDFSKPLSSQKREAEHTHAEGEEHKDNEPKKEITWAQYVHDEALESMQNTYAFYLEAVAANNGDEPEITAEQKQELKETLEKYRETANGYGYTLSAYLVKAMGKGVTEQVFIDEATRAYIAENYKSSLGEELSKKVYTDDDYNKYKEEHKDELTAVDIKVFDCSVEDDAKAFKKELKADGSNFAELCSKYSESEFDKSVYKEDGYSTEIGATKSTLKSKSYAFAVDDKDGNESKGMEWLFSKDRKAGDIYQQSTSVVYVIAPAKIEDRSTVDVRHILIAPETEEGKSAKDADAKKWEEAYQKAEKLLNDWKSGAQVTEGSFAALVKDNSADTGSVENGGLYEDVPTNQMVNSFSAWCFDASRSKGDTAIVRSDYGYHIMYFVEKNDTPIWKITAQEALSKDDSTSATNKITDSYEVKESWLGSRYFQKDVDIDRG